MESSTKYVIICSRKIDIPAPNTGACKDRWVGDLVAVEVQDRQHRAVIHWVEIFVQMCYQPGEGEDFGALTMFV